MSAIFTRGFVLVTAAALGHMLAIGLIASTIALLVAQKMGLSPELIGFTIALSAVAAVSARAPIGSAIDRHGTRRFGIAGSAFVALSAVLFALAEPGQVGTPFAPDLPLLVPLASLVWGLGISTFSTASSTYLANTVPAERRAESMGYFGLGMVVGQGLGSGFGYSIVASAGFGVLYGVAAASCLIACALFALVREVRPSVKEARPQRVGFEPRVLPPTVGMFSLTLATGFGLTLVPLMGPERGLPNPGVFFLASAAASVVGRLLGRVGDRNRLRAIVPGMLIAALAPLILTQATSLEAALVAGAAAGLGMSIAQPALQALAVDLAPPNRRGAGMATFTAAMDVGVLVGTSVAGILFTHYSFGGAFAIAAAAPALGLLSLLVLRRRSARQMLASPEPGRP